MIEIARSYEQPEAKVCILETSSDRTLPEREVLLALLEHEKGIYHALFSYPELRHLRITYDPDKVSPVTLLDTVKRHQFSASLGTNALPVVERILLAIEGSNSALRTVRYVGRILQSQVTLHVCLYCRLPRLPLSLVEHGGSENPVQESLLDEHAASIASEWLSEQQNKVLPLLEAARAELLGANVSAEAIEIESSMDASAGESLAEALIRVANASGCHTIAIGRQHGFGFSEHIHQHNADRLVRSANGLALWIVE